MLYLLGKVPQFQKPNRTTWIPVQHPLPNILMRWLSGAAERRDVYFLSFNQQENIPGKRQLMQNSPRLTLSALHGFDSYKKQCCQSNYVGLKHNYIHYACTTSRIWTLTRLCKRQAKGVGGVVDRVRVNLLNKWQRGCALGCWRASLLHK